MLVIAISIVIALFLLWVLSGYLPTRNVATPAYTVVEKAKGYDIRQYDEYIVAETVQTGNQQDSLNRGFGELFQYIAGNNISGTTVSMTAPVLQSGEAAGRKIPMTAPVMRQGAGGASAIAFVMPPGSSLEQLPQPKSALVTLRVVAPHKAAVSRFSGYASEATVAGKTEALLAALARDGKVVKTVPQSAFYNPPWTPPFMRRNEVMVEIE